MLKPLTTADLLRLFFCACVHVPVLPPPVDYSGKIVSLSSDSELPEGKAPSALPLVSPSAHVRSLTGSAGAKVRQCWGSGRGSGSEALGTGQWQGVSAQTLESWRLLPEQRAV